MADRYDSLREILKRPLKGNSDLIALMREIGYAVIFIAEDLSTLHHVRAVLVNMNKALLEFIQDSLLYRKKRINREGGAHEDLIDTQDLLDKLDRIKNTPFQAPPTAQQSQTPTVQFSQPVQKPNWFTEKVVPTITGSVLTLIVIKLLEMVFAGK